MRLFSNSCTLNVGISYSKTGRQDLAIADFSKVLEINADHVNAAFARAACFNTIGQFSRAIEDYNVALLKDQVVIFIREFFFHNK